ncbi:unnamed protein product [Ceutorhynchus assimilis]|uniref:Uncharacterized protein n=1 Tax=Ceutorhynchus assimilis TaxID=467358 RepID=A0A9N9MZ94_9CUCU|nr:unnamed protein product [Ceutorhynchus assimilis]
MIELVNFCDNYLIDDSKTNFICNCYYGNDFINRKFIRFFYPVIFSLPSYLSASKLRFLTFQMGLFIHETNSFTINFLFSIVNP